MVKETAIKIARDYISHIPEEIAVKTAYLFGSYAIGNQSEESDIDVVVVTGSSNNIFDIQMQFFRIRRRIDIDTISDYLFPGFIKNHGRNGAK